MYVVCSTDLQIVVHLSLMWCVFCFFQPCSRENVDRASDEREYEDEILAEVVELEAEYEEDYQRKQAEYKKQLEEWKLWRRKQVPTRARCINQSILTNCRHIGTVSLDK